MNRMHGKSLRTHLNDFCIRAYIMKYLNGGVLSKEAKSKKLLEQHYYRLVRIGFFKGEHVPKREEGDDL